MYRRCSRRREVCLSCRLSRLSYYEGTFGIILDSLKRLFMKEPRCMSGPTHLSLVFSLNEHERTMASYELNSVVPSPAYYTTFIEVSPDGRFLAVGDRDLRSLYILDRSAGFHPILSAPTLESPTALVWETSAAFYVGMADGRFTYYTINLEDKKLVKEKTNSAFRGGFPITAMALDRESRTLALSVGPEVFAFRRIHATSTFRSSMTQNSRLTLLKANLVSPATYRVDSILRMNLGGWFLRSREPFVLPPTAHSL
jgi:hypothetical protein